MVRAVKGKMTQRCYSQLWLTLHLSFCIVAKIIILSLEGAALLTLHERVIVAGTSDTFGSADFHARTTFPPVFSPCCMRQTLVLSQRQFSLLQPQRSKDQKHIVLLAPGLRDKPVRITPQFLTNT